jgi:acetylornithine deacetylase/succinyl-diaminopimelate desuccinylase-like protein
MKALVRSLAVLAGIASAVLGAPASPPAHQRLARSIYQELVEMDTTRSSGDTAKAARAMAARLVAAGFAKDDVQVFEPHPGRGNLIARLHGTGKARPILLVAHLDVVEAKREDWTTDPFKLIERDGYFYGRGTLDDKFMAAAWVANLVRWKQAGYRPDRDVVLVLETDEEAGDPGDDGMPWLIAHHRDLLDAKLALIEGSYVAVKDGKPVWIGVETTQKRYQTFALEARNKGGHSSQPRKDNAIYEVAAALLKIDDLVFPVELNATTRAYFEKMATLEHGQVASDMHAVLAARPDPAAIARLTETPLYNALLRTTCVVTRFDGGHADNALPQLARATVNCRILPGHGIDEVQAALATAIADPGVAITPVNQDVASDPSSIPPSLQRAIERVAPRFWPGIPVVQVMSAGASDARFLRNAGIPAFGHRGLATDILDVRQHGKDERVSVKAFYEGVEYLSELVTVLAGGG